MGVCVCVCGVEKRREERALTLSSWDGGIGGGRWGWDGR